MDGSFCCFLLSVISCAANGLGIDMQYSAQLDVEAILVVEPG